MIKPTLLFIIALLILPIALADSTAPLIQIFLGSDANGTHEHQTSSLTIFANLWNIDPEGAVSSCQLDWGEGAGWQTVSTGIAATPYNLSHTFASYGTKLVNYRCTSAGGTTSGNVQHTNYDLISIPNPSFDSTPPNISIYLGQYPDFARYTTATSYDIFAYLWNYDFESNVTLCRINWGEGAGLEIIPTGNESQTYYVNHTYSTQGNKTINYSCSSTGGTTNSLIHGIDYDYINIASLPGDTTAPITKITLGNSTGANNTQTTVLNVFATLKNSDGLSFVNYCSINWNDGSGWENITAGIENVEYYLQHNYSAHGNKTVNYTCTSAGGTNTTQAKYKTFSTIEILPIASDFSAPLFFNITQSPAGPVVYAPGTSYVFNITFTDVTGIGSVSSNYTGPSSSGGGGGILFGPYPTTYSLPQSFTDLTPGTYNFSWSATDVRGQSNSTSISYVIQKVQTQTNITINGNTNQNLTITFGQIVNISSSTSAGVSNISINGTSTQNPSVNLLVASGSYNITAINQGNLTHNGSSMTAILNVQKSAGQVSLTVNGSFTNITVEEQIPINVTATLLVPVGFVSALLDNLGAISSGIGTATANYVFNLTGTHVFIASFNGNQNYSAANYSINISVADTRAPFSISNLTNISATETSILWNWTSPTTYDFTSALLYLNGTNIQNASAGPFNSTNLTPNSFYILEVATIDDDKNINATLISSVGKTLGDFMSPLFSSVQTPQNPFTYSPAYALPFNVTVSDNVKIGTVIFQIDQSNYTAPLSGGKYFAIISPLAAGSHNFTWFANDSSGNSNSTLTAGFNVSKASTTTDLQINSALNTDLTIVYSSPLNVTAQTSAASVILFRNGTSVSNPDFTSLGAGSYGYLAVNSGNINYSGSTTTQTLTVIEANGSIILLINGVFANLTSDIEDDVNITAKVLSGEKPLNLEENSFLLNSTGNLSLIRQYANASLFVITANLSSTQNFTGQSKTINLTTVNLRPPFSVNNVANQSQSETSIYWNWTNPANKDFSFNMIFLNGTNIQNTSQNFYNATGLATFQQFIITINTVDSVGNINLTNISSAAFTLDGVAPTYSFLTSPAASTYSPTKSYLFSSVWTDNLELRNVSIIFDGSINTTSNQSANSSNFTFFLPTLAAGDYQYNWTGQDSGGKFNSTGTLNFTVLKQITLSSVSIDSLFNQNATLNYKDFVNVSSLTTNGTVKLYRDGALLVFGNDTSKLGAGKYVYVARNDGNQNFSASNASVNLTIDPIASRILLALNSSSSNITAEVGSQVIVNAILNEGEGNLTLGISGVNQTNSSNITTIISSQTPKLTTVSLLYSLTQNYTANSTSFNITFVDTTKPAISNLTGPFGPSVYSPTKNLSFSANITENVAVGTVVFELNGTNLTLGNSSSISFIGLASGPYNYSWHVNDSSGNKDQVGPISFVIVKQNTTATISINGALNQNTTIVYGQPLNVSAMTTNSSVYLQRNSTNISNPDLTYLASGFYIYGAINPGDFNFTNSNAFANLSVTQAQSVILLSANNLSSNSTIEAGGFVSIVGQQNAGESVISLFENGALVNSSRNVSYYRQYLSTQMSTLLLNYTTTQNYTYSESSINITVIDTAAPTYSLLSGPVFMPYSYNSTYLFSSMWSDVVNISQVLFLFNGTNLTTSNSSGNFTRLIGALAAGNYTYRWHATDSSGNANQTPNAQLEVSRQQSTVTLLLNGSAVNISAQAGQEVNITGTSNGENQLSLLVDQVQVNLSKSPVLYLATFSTDGVHNISLTHLLSENFSASTVSSTITVPDTVAPLISVFSPQNNSIVSTGTLLLNVSAQDTNPANISYRIDAGSQVILASLFNSSKSYTANISLSEGNHTISIFANDAGMSNLTSVVYVTVDTIAPSVTSYVPNSTINGSSSLIQAIFNEYISRGELTLDGVNMSSQKGNYSLNFTATGLANGTHNVIAHSFDRVNNSGMFSWNFTVDREGFLRGFALSNSSSPLFNANISAYNGTRIVYSVLSDPTGYYAINGFDEGHYNITFAKSGYVSTTFSIIMNGSAELTRNASLMAVPDSSSTSISLSQNFVGGQTLQVNSTISYSGDSNTALTAVLYVDGSGYSNTSIFANSTPFNAQFNWTAVEGTHTLTVGVLPVAGETNNVNNNATGLAIISPIQSALSISQIELYDFAWSIQITNTTKNAGFNIFMTIVNNQTFTLRDISSALANNSNFTIINGTNPQAALSIAPGDTAYVTWLANATTIGTQVVNVTTEGSITRTKSLQVNP